MKNSLAIILMLLTVSGTANAQPTKPAFDKRLADSLGADEYGMKMYTFVILKTGTATIEKKETVDSLFRGHMGNISRMSEAGKLIVAGPIQKNARNYRGLFILDVKTETEARKLLADDPAVASGLLEAELFQWYGSAALPLYLPFHYRVQKTDF